MHCVKYYTWDFNTIKQMWGHHQKVCLFPDAVSYKSNQTEISQGSSYTTIQD